MQQSLFFRAGEMHWLLSQQPAAHSLKP